MTTNLLQRIAKCAPTEMGAEFCKGSAVCSDSVSFNTIRWESETDCWVVELVATDEPYVNSQGCEAMLDAIEKAGVVVWLSLRVYCEDPENDRLDVDGYECSGYRLKGSSANFECYGPTRAIAVGEAFCKVFEVKG